MLNVKRQIIILVAILFTVACSKKTITKTASVTGVLRVMAYNVHHCNPPSKDSLIDVDAIANVIKTQNPDLVALQEIDVNTKRSGLINEAKLLGHKTGMKVFFGKSIDYDGGEYGLAILSRLPISEETIHRLPTEVRTKGEPRIFVTVKVKMPDGRFIRFGTVHFDAQKANLNRELQIKELEVLAKAESLPMIVAGDFNSYIKSSVIDQLDRFMTRTCQDCPPTIPVINPKNTIDFIAFKPKGVFHIISHKVIPERYASDHLPVVAELKVSGK